MTTHEQLINSAANGTVQTFYDYLNEIFTDKNSEVQPSKLHTFISDIISALVSGGSIQWVKLLLLLETLTAHDAQQASYHAIISTPLYDAISAEIDSYNPVNTSSFSSENMAHLSALWSKLPDAAGSMSCPVQHNLGNTIDEVVCAATLSSASGAAASIFTASAIEEAGVVGAIVPSASGAVDQT
jgi:hypothetical protein